MVTYVTFAAIPVCWVAWLVSQVVTYRRTHGVRRWQLKWLLSGAVVFFISEAVLFSDDTPAGWMKAAEAVALAGTFALPASMGFGILRFRLFDIDRIISRTLAYALVTGTLAGLYAALVLLATRLLGVSSSVSVAGATLVAAALFSPLRHRLQRVVDRRFSRARYDAEQTMAAFAARLADATDLSAVRADLAGVVTATMEPEHLSVWLADR